MDAFFASVEVLDRPELSQRPVIVGGTGRRGVVASASYAARAYGVHSAMPTSRARRQCPQAAFLPGRHSRYAEVSAQVMEVFASFTPLVEPLSLDEAFLDVTGALHGGAVEELAHQVRRRVLNDVGLICSVGAAANKLLAKLATAEAKPTATPRGPRPGPGVVVVENEDVTSFLRPMAVQALWGVGAVTLGKLARLGVATIGDLADTSRQMLISTLGEAAGNHLAELARGHDERPVVVDRRAKSIGQEETFAEDRHGLDQLLPVLSAQCDVVAGRLRQHGVGARTVTIKVRFGDFTTVTRSVTLRSPTDLTVDLREAATHLLRILDPSEGVRLIGVSASGLAHGAPRQLRLDEAGDPRGETDRVVEKIRARWGHGAIGPGRIGSGERSPTSPWGPADRD